MKITSTSQIQEIMRAQAAYDKVGRFLKPKSTSVLIPEPGVEVSISDEAKELIKSAQASLAIK